MYSHSATQMFSHNKDFFSLSEGQGVGPRVSGPCSFLFWHNFVLYAISAIDKIFNRVFINVRIKPRKHQKILLSKLLVKYFNTDDTLF